jgi:hypothetical protein
MTEMLEKPTVEDETNVDPRLAEVLRIIVDQFDGDIQAYWESIRPKNIEPRPPKAHRPLFETVTRCL